MKRRDLFKNLGAIGAGALIPSVGSKAAETIAQDLSLPVPPACVLIPSETEGPFPLDLTANATFFRQDVRESKTGVRLDLKLRIIGLTNCQPMRNVRVNIWGCDKDGLYSGYSQTNNPGQAGLTYLRGYQMTNNNGEVDFITIFPGWYTGRICHIHFQVWVSSVYRAVSQLTFPIATKNAIYAANSALYTKGADPLTFATDNIFSDGYEYQLATLTANAATGGYSSYLELGIQGTGTTGLWNAEPETGGQFKLAQNFPNPYSDATTVPFTLINAAHVKLRLFDLQGRQVAEIKRANLSAGEHQIGIDTKALGIPNATYAYELEVENSAGTFRQSKLMTVLQ
jgi:protocatechuate 3,4-dioxygenase beta subunit